MDLYSDGQPGVIRAMSTRYQPVSCFLSQYGTSEFVGMLYRISGIKHCERHVKARHSNAELQCTNIIHFFQHVFFCSTGTGIDRAKEESMVSLHQEIGAYEAIRSDADPSAPFKLSPPHQPLSSRGRVPANQCCRFSRNIAQVTPKIIYFYYQKICLQDESIRIFFYLILKKTSLLQTIVHIVCSSKLWPKSSESSPTQCISKTGTMHEVNGLGGG